MRTGLQRTLLTPAGMRVRTGRFMNSQHPSNSGVAVRSQLDGEDTEQALLISPVLGQRRVEALANAPV